MDRVLEPEVMDTLQEAQAYDAMDHSGPNIAFVDRLVELGASGRMLDIGTGPGHIPIMVCERITGGRVLAVDMSRHMLEIAKGRLARSTLAGTGRVVFQVTDAKALPYPDAQFDCVFSNTILHHIRQPQAAIAEAWRVLRPNGVFLVRDLYRPPDRETLAHLVATHAGDDTPRQQQLFRASLMAALTPNEMRMIVASLNLTQVEVTMDTDRHLSIQRPAT